MEFVFSVHPSNENAKPESPETQKQGAGITHEAVALATKLLCSVPVSMTPQSWFQGISGQLFDLVDGKDGPDLSRTTAQIIGFGILGKKALGAPGKISASFLWHLLTFSRNTGMDYLCPANTGEHQPGSEGQSLRITR